MKFLGYLRSPVRLVCSHHLFLDESHIQRAVNLSTDERAVHKEGRWGWAAAASVTFGVTTFWSSSRCLDIEWEHDMTFKVATTYY